MPRAWGVSVYVILDDEPRAERTPLQFDPDFPFPRVHFPTGAGLEKVVVLVNTTSDTTSNTAILLVRLPSLLRHRFHR